MNYPTIIENHFCNICTGDCVVCSKAHGGWNPWTMTREVWEATLADIEASGQSPVMQLGGDGDALLHNEFLPWVTELRDRLPKCHRCLYTNAYSLDGDTARRIEGGRLLHEVQIRIDSLAPETYEQSTALPLDVVRANIERFARINKHARLCIIYFPLYLYRQAVQRILGKEPTYAGRVEAELRDEWADVRAWADNIGVESRVTGLSLWAERTDCRWSDMPCPRLPENKPGDMRRQLFVYPSGNLGICGYDDQQEHLLIGNILKDRIADVWFGDRMNQQIERVRRKTP